MGKIRFVFLFTIIAAGIGITVVLFREQPKTRLQSSLAPAYQLFGHATKGINRALAVAVRVDDLDEKEYGDAIVQNCDLYQNPDDKDFIYTNNVMKDLIPYKKKPFDYHLYIYEDSSPNAFALPGGVIFVTRGLLTTIHSQAELAAVLAHEMGHIELSHCVDSVKFELAAKKLGVKTLGEFADEMLSMMMRHSFSKTQEDQADTYAFEILTAGKYNPSAEGAVYESFIVWLKKNGVESRKKADIIRDYFMSHPPLEIRAEKFTEEAHQWWKENPKEKRYSGVANLKTRSIKELKNEWHTGK